MFGLWKPYYTRLAILFSQPQPGYQWAQQGGSDGPSKFKHGMVVDYGLLGSKWVFRALSDIGRTDLAYRMLINPSSPSMLDWRKEGATSLWEDWGDGASRNHVMYGDFAGWVYRCLAGIDLGDDIAFRKTVIAPCPVPGLNRLQASVETPYGILACSWWRKNDGISYEVVVPPGTSAELQLPGLPKRCVEVGTHNFHSAW